MVVDLTSVNWMPVEPAKQSQPHPEEAALLGGRLEGSPRVRAVHPSFETPCFARLLRMRLSISSQARGWARFALPTLRVKLQLRRSSTPTFLFSKRSV